MKHKGNGQPSTTTFSAKGSTKQPPAKPFIPSFEASQHTEKLLPDDYQTVYSRYKAATKRVFEYLEAYAREKNNLENDEPMAMHVDSLVIAADWMAESNIPVDSDILKDLKFAIRVRSKVARNVYGGGDSGHKYLLDTLVYCWKVLEPLPRVGKKTIAREKEEVLEDHGEGLSSNRFEALKDTFALDDDEDEEIFSSQDVTRPTFDDKPILLKDLLDSEDRTDSILFLVSLDRIMGWVADPYAKLGQNADVFKQVLQAAKQSWSAAVPGLMGCAIQTNFAIQQIQRLETEFELQNPHINTPHRLLSMTHLFTEAETVLNITREHGQRLCSERDAFLFMGDCFECCFPASRDAESRGSEIVSDFCSRFEIDSEGSKAIKKVYSDLWLKTKFEVPLKKEIEAIGENVDYHITSHHRWFNPFKHIGDGRSIHHTIRLLQEFGMQVDLTSKDLKLQPPKGSYGSSPWHPGRSNKIYHDLDELLMVEILPHWVFMCIDWLFDSPTKLPGQSELAPLWGCIRRFAHSPEEPLKWSTIFAVQAMLTAILETDKIANEIASGCQTTFDLYFHQLDIACKHKKAMCGAAEFQAFQSQMEGLKVLKQLAHPHFGQRALWNPICAGSCLLYLNFTANIEVGSRLMDDRSQLKIVLHLYHALLVNNLLQPEDIPFLDGLYIGFAKSEKLWGGPSLPRKGKFMEQFWSSMGGSLEDCEKGVALRFNPARMEPEEFSKSYRRICKRDYQDVLDRPRDLTEERQKRSATKSDIYIVGLQSADTIAAFGKENYLFEYNFAACGVYLDEFVCAMSHHFHWDAALKKFSVREKNKTVRDPERMMEAYWFAHDILGQLDDVKSPSELGRVGRWVTTFVLPFFQTFSKIREKCFWY